MEEIKEDYASKLKYEIIGKFRDLIWGIDFSDIKDVELRIDDSIPDETSIYLNIILSKEE